MSANKTCPNCGKRLPPSALEGLCPECMLKVGAVADSVPETVAGSGGTLEMPPDTAPTVPISPQVEEDFGNYHVLRRLGHGGMGVVYEAVEKNSGRRVALKVINQKLSSPQDRARFLREGRLAAAINHPNCVYVFGTEDVEGTPVISMEFVPGGTLHQRVAEQGPLAVNAAVDAILQIIAGLEAAQAAGILHRDIKPSNCFEDEQGTVKIGDFGLSISTLPRAETNITDSGAMVGTPAFCSPEQLRGEELSIRSDIYSVGVTLYYLLTGKMPFQGGTMPQLIANTLEKKATSPRQHRADVPNGLARLILRCLSKHPSERFKSYRDLMLALEPYGSSAPTPGTLAMRFLAAGVDMVLLSLLGQAVILLVFGNPFVLLDRFMDNPVSGFYFAAPSCVLVVLYFAVSEWHWGATLGKALCRLRVVQPDRSYPSLPQALIRAAIYVLVPILPYWVFAARNPASLVEPTLGTYVLSLSYYALLALLFVTVRRRNGFASVHDLASGTRVISRMAHASRPAVEESGLHPADVESQPMVGPYHVLQPLGRAGDAEWMECYDMRLLRRVLLRTVPAGTPPLPAACRQVARPGRLRWLTGRRDAHENWDALEGTSGQPLSALVRRPQPWSRVRFWLHDLASELGAAEKDGTLPPVLALDRVWITSTGRAKLLDFPAPETGEGHVPLDRGLEDATPLQTADPAVFLQQVAVIMLGGDRSQECRPLPPELRRLPLHAQRFLEMLPGLAGPEAVAAALRPLLRRVAEVTRARRAVILAGCVVIPLFLSLAGTMGVLLMQHWQAQHPQLIELSNMLNVWRAKQMPLVPAKKLPNDRLIGVYIAAHYGEIITNEALWSSGLTRMFIPPNARRFAEQSLVECAAAPPEEREQAEQSLGSMAEQSRRAMMPGPLFAPFLFWFSLLVYAGLPAMIAAVCFRGGLVLLATGVAYVRRDGQKASRLRLLWRGAVAWSPVALALVLCGVALGVKSMPLALLAGLPALLLAGCAVLLPERGLQDRLAGTWPVPR